MSPFSCRFCLMVSGMIMLAAPAVAASFTFTALVPPDATQPAVVTGISGDQAVGSETAGSSTEAFAWSNGIYTQLPQFYDFSAVSDNGLAVALSLNSDFGYAIYNLATGAISNYQVPVPAGTDFVYFTGINSSGTVSVDEYSEHRGLHIATVLQDVDGVDTMIDPDRKSHSVGLSDEDTVLLYRTYAKSHIYESGKLKTLVFPGLTQVQPNFISSNGVITGTFGSDQIAGFVRKGNKTTTFSVPGSIDTSVRGVNPAGEVVGSYIDAKSKFHGFVYSDKLYYTIDFPHATNTMITGVSATGAIIGYYGSSINLPFIAVCSTKGVCTK